MGIGGIGIPSPRHKSSLADAIVNLFFPYPHTDLNLETQGGGYRIDLLLYSILDGHTEFWYNPQLSKVYGGFISPLDTYHNAIDFIAALESYCVCFAHHIRCRFLHSLDGVPQRNIHRLTTFPHEEVG